MKLKGLLLAFGLTIAGMSPAFAQCTGQSLSGNVCGNPTASTGLPAFVTQSAMLDRAFGAVQGRMLSRGSSVWAGTAVPSLGLNGTAGGSLTLQGSTSGSAAITVQAAAGTATLFQLPNSNGTNNQVLTTDGSGHLTWVSVAGTGTVTSVGLALPGIFTVSGSPVTNTGTLTGTLATQSANLVWAGPTTGAAAAPTFRSLVGADLPNPSASTLGGIQSTVGATHQWISTISTLGVPGLTQPAFTDISGTLGPSQCPNPSASTIGCVESYVAVANQWINAISTSGVPSSTQPNFNNLAGSATLSQLPSISNNSVLGNNSGGTAVPSTLSTTNVLDFIGTTQGQILYRNASAWVALAPGTSGQVLATGGAAANPAWQTVSGTGTVTSVATNNGITGGAITTTGTIGLATIATGNALAYTGAGSGVPVATTPSSLLDVIGAATGDLLYRSGGGWTVLAPGTNGQVLTQGASTPAWGNAGTLTNVTISAGTGIGTSGTCNISTSGTCTVALSSARQTLPTRTLLTSGSGTYTTPANTLWIEVKMVGGGGGGAGGDTGGGAGGNGGNTTFNAGTQTANGGAGGGTFGNAPAIGGTASGGDISIQGNPGGAWGPGAASAVLQGPTGGSGPWGGAGYGGWPSAGGVAGQTNSGSGGGGGGAHSSGHGGNSGSAGGYLEKLIVSPSATYSYAIGAGGTAGTSTGSEVGGAGGSGQIIIVEHYGS